MRRRPIRMKGVEMEIRNFVGSHTVSAGDAPGERHGGGDTYLRQHREPVDPDEERKGRVRDKAALSDDMGNLIDTSI